MLESGEMYIETIYLLKSKKDKVHAIDIANELKYAKSSVSRALNILKSKQIITINGVGEIEFTEQGCAIAREIYERHNVLTKFLKQIGLPDDIAETDACRIEHVISKETLLAIKNQLK
jgi:Mn-dependent DtxR family transcriptional regulator